MKGKKRKFKLKRKWQKQIILLLFAVITVFFLKQGEVVQTAGTDIAANADGSLKVHFIDVGQADCILIQAGGHNMLVDAGNNGDGKKIRAYLDAQGITEFDYVIATHAHEDHIGGMDEIIGYYDIGALFLPDQTYETKSFADVLSAADMKDVDIIHPKFKDVYTLGEAKFIFIMPDADREYSDVNDSSLGIRIGNGVHSFLMCGDASKEMEEEFLKSNVYLHADVFKVSHHGSNDANSKQFLKKVDPEYAVIMCEEGNSYGHPHASVIKRLQSLDIKMFRTDVQGTIVFTSNGEQLICNANPSEE